MSLVLWLAATSWARPMELATSRGTEVVVMPRTQSLVAEVGLYGNRAYLRHKVAAWRAEGLDHARLVDVGGGIEFVELTLLEEDLVPKVVEGEEGHWTLRLVPAEVEVPAVPVAPTVLDLLAGLHRHPAELRDLGMVPLMRDGRTYNLSPTTIRLQIPDDEGVPPSGYEVLLGRVDEPTWVDVESWRALARDLEEPDLVALAYRRLAEAHAALGLPREARYYYGEALKTGAPSVGAWLGRADAALSVRDWDTARAACTEAALLGGQDEEVLICFGVLSLATSSPPPAETGRALAAVATRRTAKFLAGDLLLRDGYAEEALPLLEASAPTMRGEAREVAWLAVGDAALAMGDPERARAAYHEVRHGRLDELLELREMLVSMLADGTRRYPAWVPRLVDFAEGGGPAAPDAWWLLAQVHASFGDAQSETEALSELWDMHPAGREGSGVGRRLLAACGERLTQLAHDERDADAVNVFSKCWRPGLLRLVEDTDLLAHASTAWERLGIVDEALAVQEDLTTVLAAQAREEAAPLVRLAGLQTSSGWPERALDTLLYAAPFADAWPDRRRIDLVRADAHEALGQWELAVKDLRAAARSAELAPIAERRRLELQLRHGRCREVAGPMRVALEKAPFPEEAGGDLELLLARCFVELGRPAEGLALTELALKRAEDEYAANEAKWLATAVSEHTGLPIPSRLRSDSATFALLDTEAARDEAWTRELEAWKR